MGQSLGDDPCVAILAGGAGDTLDVGHAGRHVEVGDR